MVNIYLGIDGGGTKTKAAVINDNLRLIARGESGVSNLEIVGLTKAIENLSLAVTDVLKNIKSDQIFGCFALAGVNFEKDKKIWHQAIIKDKFLSSVFSKPPTIVNDIIAALKSGTSSQNAIVIISGTGSNCYGRNKKGEEVKVGGVGHILSDEGSGYWIGQEILRSVVRALDGRGEPTVLKELVFKRLKVNSLEQLAQLVYQKPWDKTDIGQVAPLIEEAAREKDKRAIEIINQAGHDLATMVKTVVLKLNLKDKNFTVVTSGSVFKLRGLICQHLEEDVKKFAPKAEFVDQTMDAAQAAALIALDSETEGYYRKLSL